MKKLILLLTCVFMMIGTSFSQEGIFYKAGYLMGKYNSVTGKITMSNDEFNAIKDLFPGDDDNTILSKLNSNPFFTNMFLKQPGASGVTGFNFATGGIGSLDVTTIATGTASLLVDRAKQELTVAFFNRFKKFSDKNPEFQILFPKTTNILIGLLSYSYPQMLPVLKTSFLEDLNQLPYNLEGLLELPRYQILVKKFPEVRIAIKTLGILRDFEKSTVNAAEAIDKFANLSDWNDPGSAAFKNMQATVKFSSILSQSLRSKDNGRIWVTNGEIKGLFTDEVKTKLFLGLIYQAIKMQPTPMVYYFDLKSPATATDFADDIFAKQKDNMLLIQNRISQFISLASKVSDCYNDIESKKLSGEKFTDTDYNNYISLSIDVIDYSFGVVKVFDKRLTAEDYLKIARQLNNLYKDIYSKHYTQAVNDAVDILTGVSDLIADNSTVSNGLTADEQSAKKDSFDKLTKFVKKVKPYAIFAGNVADAKTSDDVKAALENVILPVGSSSIKKNAKFNLSIQSYLGAFGRTSGKNYNTNGAWSDHFGVTAPIGISLTPGCLSWQQYGAVSLFIPFFDLGAIVDYQLKLDNSTTNQQVISKDYSVKLGQIVSPGVYAVYGFPVNLPLSLGFGAQYGPGLSKIDGGTLAVVTNPTWRWNFFLAVDLPFFNVVNMMKHN